MTEALLRGLAQQVRRAGARDLPTFLLVREVPVFEVDFESLEFTEETQLAASDWAALALAEALGEIGPSDLDGYLGLGEALSEALVHRLLESGMLQEAPPSQGRRVTSAPRVKEPLASELPRCALSPHGEGALRRGVVIRLRSRPARASFITRPLHFLRLLDEKDRRYSEHRRARVLDPEDVPQELQSLDESLGLPSDERAMTSGIGGELPGIAGQFVGVEPGSQWEVRPRRSRKREGNGDSQVMATLVLAGFRDGEGMSWRSFVKDGERFDEARLLEPSRLLDPALCSTPVLLFEANRDASTPISEDALQSDGAFVVACTAAQLESLVGDGDRPEDCYLISPAFEDWSLGVRARMVPIDRCEERRFFYLYLRRREPDLRRDFDATCTELIQILADYWGESSGLPTSAEAVQEAWAVRELRAALCRRRLDADLIEPYQDRVRAR